MMTILRGFSMTKPFKLSALLAVVTLVALVLVSASSSASPLPQGSLVSYSGELDLCDSTYERLNEALVISEHTPFYYEYQEFTVASDGSYTMMMTDRNFDGFFDLYEDAFDPIDPVTNAIAANNDAGGNNRPQIVADLTAGVTYILVTSTYNPFEGLGAYSNEISGDDTITLGASNITDGTGCAIPTYTPTPTPTDSAPPEPVVYSGLLDYCDPMFAKLGMDFTAAGASEFFYEMQEFTVDTDGSYTMTMVSASFGDAFFNMYADSFDPDNPTLNAIAVDDDAGGGLRPQIVTDLLAGTTYILVSTTYSPNVVGSYTDQIGGVGQVTLGASNITFDCTITPTPAPTEVPVPVAFTGFLDYCDSTYARADVSLTSTGDNGYFYEMQEFTVNSDGLYTLTMLSSEFADGFFNLYADSFDPNDFRIQPYRGE